MYSAAISSSSSVEESPRSGQEQLHGVGHPGVAGLAYRAAGPLGVTGVELLEKRQV